MTITIRKSTFADIPHMREIFAHARQFMAETGNPNQWTNDYPSEEFLHADIESGDSYVCISGHKIVATFLLRGGIDPTYRNIYEGAWKNEEPYATIHRIASNGEVKGILHVAIQFALQEYNNIRIDTHRDNIVMQNAIRKEGFLYCGIIHCWSGDERLAYQYSKDTIVTERLILRRWHESDAEALFALASDPDVGPHAGWSAHKSVEESLQVIRDIFTNDCTWAIICKETEELIGCMGYYPHGVSNIEIGKNDAEVGYWIGKPHWNNGYCTEALKAMMNYCQKELKFSTLWADFFIDNPASGRVMQKCGFVDTGHINYCSHLFHGTNRPVHIMKFENV